MKKILLRFLSSNVIHHIFYLASAYCFVLGCSEYFIENNFYEKDRIVNCFLMIGSFFLIKYAISTTPKRNRICCALFSLLLSLVLVIGRPIYLYDNFADFFTAGKLVTNCLTVIGFTAVFHAILALINQQLIDCEPCFTSTPWKMWRYPLLFGILFFLAWMPVYLAYYPGSFAYDITDQTRQILGMEPFTKYHPPLHSWYWQLCIILEQTLDINALVFYSITQMLIVAAALTYVLSFLIKRGTNNWLLLITVLFFCFNPCIALLSFNPTKDVLFAVFLAVYTIELCSFLAEKDKYLKNPMCNLRMIVFGILSCLLRNNMVYALIPAVLIMVVILRQYWKRLLLWGLSIILGYTLINGPLYSALGVGDGNVREMLNVPIQQLSYVVVNHEMELSEQDLNDIQQYIPLDVITENYNPRITDRVKVHFNTACFEEDSSTFFDVWFRLLRSYPIEYIEAFLNLNLPLWYPDAATVDVHTYETYISAHINFEPECGYAPIRASKIPWLYEKYRILASYEFFQDLPVISKIFSINTPVWMLLASMHLLFIKKKKQLIIPLLPAFFVWCTYLLGPVSIFRYVFPIMMLYPLYLTLVLQPQIMKNE